MSSLQIRLEYVTSKDFVRAVGPLFEAVFHRPLVAKESQGQGGSALLNILLYADLTLVGWHFGRKSSATEYEMTNTCILPEFRRRGLYSLFVTELIKDLQAQGIKRIYSRHRPANAAILEAKRKLGFGGERPFQHPDFGSLIEVEIQIPAKN